MQKLSSRLHKISTKSPGVIDKAWSHVADQFDAQASIHSNFGSAITDDIVQPLRTIFNSQNRTIRATEQLVNRELRFLSVKRDDLSKIKRLLHCSSRDLEKIEQLIDNDHLLNIKLSIRKRKILNQVIKQEQTYIEETIATERQRRVTDGVLRKGVEYLEIVEKQRLAHCQTALGRFQRKIAQMGPNLNMMFERYMNALNDAVSADLNEQIAVLAPTCSSNHTIYLCDFHAENFGEVMAGQRRRWSLERVNAILHDYLERTHLSTTPTLPSLNVANFSYIEFLEYLIYKVGESLKSIDGTQNREYHRLARFQQKLQDKVGLTQTILTIPLDEFENAEKPSAPSLPAQSSVEDDNNSEIREAVGHYAVARSLSYDESQIMQNSSPSTSSSNNDATKQIYRVLYDFTAATEDELNVHAGDCVLVESKIGDDWLIGQIISNNQMNDAAAVASHNNKIGRFPASYVAFAHSA